MTVQQGDTGKITDGVLKTVTFTNGTPYENLIGTPVSVPNQGTIPGSPIASYTVTQSNFPTISRMFSTKYNGFLVFGGKSTDGTARTVNWQVNKNGSTSNSGTFSATANQFWTMTNYKLLDIAVGDVLDIYVWCSSSSLINFDYVGFFIMPCFMQLSNAKLLKDVTFNFTTTSAPSLTQGVPGLGSNGSIYSYPTTSNVVVNASYGVASNTSYTFPYITGLNPVRIQYGDSNNQGQLNYSNATNRPQYVRNFFPASISFREVLR